MIRPTRGSLVLFLKGCCMGVADVVPGVSGGTLALILGIYRRLVESIRDLHLRWAAPLMKWLGSGCRDPVQKRRLGRTLRSLHPEFFLPLGTGILAALLAGGMVIPPLLANYPVLVRSLFFGLILGSFWIPLRMLKSPTPGEYGRVVLGLVLALPAGWYVTDPAGRLLTPTRWVEVPSRGETFEQLLHRAPSARSAERVFWHPRNRSYRASLRRRDPDRYAGLREHYRTRVGSTSVDREELSARSEPYHRIRVSPGERVMVPRLPLWYVTLAGGVGICAMILPGVSGAYLLIILGSYFFVLNALKGTLLGLVSGSWPAGQVLPVLLFTAGAVAGLLLFSRLLSYLLKRHASVTVGALVGLMLGCLRGVWPFRGVREGTVTNLLPAASNGTVVPAFLVFAGGVLVVLVLQALVGRVDSTGGASSR